MMRLNKFLATSGVASRRQCDNIILDGRVTVNGKKIFSLGISVNEKSDIVRLDGKRLQLARSKVYILLNKPKGYITTAHDERGRKNVLDLVKSNSRLFPVGRLDNKSEGLLLLTNDGEIANRLMHPKYKFEKTYRAKLDKPFKEEDFESLVSGVLLEDGLTAPCKARYFGYTGESVEIKIHEGRNRQVRRMFEVLGYRVKSLKRIQYGPLRLERLPRGQYRNLNQNEIMQLKEATGLTKSKKDATGKV